MSDIELPTQLRRVGPVSGIRTEAREPDEGKREQGQGRMVSKSVDRRALPLAAASASLMLHIIDQEAEMKLTRTVLLIASLLLPGVGLAQSPDTNSANYHIPGCRDVVASQGGTPGGFCSGIVFSLMGIGPELPQHRRFCAPETSSVREAVEVIVAHIDRIPSRMHERFLELSVEALRQAWPCRSGQ